MDCSDTNHGARLAALERLYGAIQKGLVDVVAGLVAGVDAAHLYRNLSFELMLRDDSADEALAEAQGMADRVDVPSPTGASADDITVTWSARDRSWWASSPHGVDCHGVTPSDAVERLCQYLSAMTLLPKDSA